MKSTIRIVTAGALALTVVMWAAPADRALAQGLFDRLFGGSDSYRDPWAERQRARDLMWERRRRARDRRRNDGFVSRRQAPPQIRVKSPSYYAYRPDAPENAAFDELAQVKVASADETAVPATPFTRAAEHLAGVRLRMLPEVAAAVRAYYSEHPAFLWVTDGQANERAQAALEAFARADRFGLEPGDYAVDVPGRSGVALPRKEDASEAGADVLVDVAAVLDEANEDARDAALIRFEILMSAKALTYALDAERGRIDANRISGYHDIVRKEVDLAAALEGLAGAPDVSAWLERRNPNNRQFRVLVKTLAKLRESDDSNRIVIAPDTFLRPDGVSPEIANIVAGIRLRGSDSLKAAHAATLAAYSGGEDYSPELVALVRDFQKEAGLRVDGVIGPNTIGALVEDSIATKIEKVVLAMERARWLPRHLGARYVFINQPAYTATYAESGKEPLTMRAVVGQKANQTNFFVDEIETVEYNPYWGVPYSIIVNEMIPQLYRDPRYLDRMGYEVSTSSGRRMSSASVDWYGVAAKRVPINVRQPPGPKNALGTVKILFPNKHNIYMHDTPAKELFEKDERAFSHGCVRLQDPWAMAAAVLGKDAGYIRGRIANGGNEAEPVTRKVPVYVAYFTAWPTPEGEVSFFGDVYDRDVYLKRALEATDEVRAAS